MAVEPSSPTADASDADWIEQNLSAAEDESSPVEVADTWDADEADRVEQATDVPLEDDERR